MPIVRWHGWAAKCGACGKFVVIGDEVVAYSKREEVLEAITAGWKFRTQEEAIQGVCGCKKKRGSK